MPKHWSAFTLKILAANRAQLTFPSLLFFSVLCRSNLFYRYWLWFIGDAAWTWPWHRLAWRTRSLRHGKVGQNHLASVNTREKTTRVSHLATRWFGYRPRASFYARNFTINPTSVSGMRNASIICIWVLKRAFRIDIQRPKMHS